MAASGLPGESARRAAVAIRVGLLCALALAAVKLLPPQRPELADSHWRGQIEQSFQGRSARARNVSLTAYEGRLTSFSATFVARCESPMLPRSEHVVDVRVADAGAPGGRLFVSRDRFPAGVMTVDRLVRFSAAASGDVVTGTFSVRERWRERGMVPTVCTSGDIGFRAEETGADLYVPYYSLTHQRADLPEAGEVS